MVYDSERFFFSTTIPQIIRNSYLVRQIKYKQLIANILPIIVYILLYIL